MDHKIYNIELVNRLLAWQHTAFKTKTSLPGFLSRARESAPKTDKPPPAQQEPIDPLNVISMDAADFVLCRKVCCFLIGFHPRCRGPPPVWISPKFRRNGGAAYVATK